MRRPLGGAPATRLCAVSLAFGMVMTTPHLAHAQPGNGDLAELVTEVANVNQKLQDLGAAIQTQQESVNKAILDVATAREDAAKAQQQVDASAAGVKEANAAIDAAQDRFDDFAAAMYVNGPSSSYLTAKDPADILTTAATGQALSLSSQKVMTDLSRARTEQVNRESAARLAKQQADDAVKAAETSQQSAVEALTNAQQTFKDQQSELDRLTAERAQAQTKLQQAQALSAPSAPSAGAGSGGASPGAGAKPAPSGANPNWDVDPSTGNRDTAWDMTLPQIPSAFVSGDPVQIINAVLKIITTSLEVTQNLGRKFLQSIGLLPTPTGITNGAIPVANGPQATEYVIKRGMSQLGVPYSWGGGNASGPSRGIDSGAGTVGFDCSGLMLYMFAGVGIKLDHYSGSQYNAGRKVPSSQMRRGDMIFYGPNASQHVAMYLGNGQMLEAPYTGSVVKISPVRTSGMTPFVTRMIEW
ncbi:NlpC/P60 family peptidoglycan endopeptidase RipA [Mycolicibacterium rufum]|uniref:NlpC/P60 family peptidoglycan endopeptidase RipA n=2 Tax=Mycolicibacterium rufum TaxID=318424 RepID=A0A9X2YBM8_9MYCO|nr:NlpC/P60 family peptidoglycan endopeptidase RipA [Mycolicibacterium rufum]KGI68121.1 peptidase M23 [Mycolicibacterium rufum]MCV7070325.1 NlpC/P60 family peptidoglycan endopeptidase RipA [Mycolicibacterium rufum]ULP39141.1 NlpC/P60 family peptidoglycan endopeptidase RipA [Mycolicibacterium rufum]